MNAEDAPGDEDAALRPGARRAGAVVVTGASSGIGRACALELDARGYEVFAGFRRTEDANSLRRDASGRLQPIRIDVADPESIREAAAQVEGALQGRGLSGLVNNAGIALGGPLEFLPLEMLRRQLEINVLGQVAVTQAFLPMLRRDAGRIVNMGSISGRFAAPFLGPYSASKHALKAISDSLRVELRPWGMHVALIEPGAIATPIWRRSRAAAEELRRDLPPAAEALYGAAMRALLRRIDRIRAGPTTAVVEAVLHAITSRRPRARYLVGWDARLRLGVEYLPTRLRDRLVARAVEG